MTLANSNAYVWGEELLQDLSIRDAWSKDTTGRRSREEGQVFLHVAGSTVIGDPVLDPDRLPTGFSARGSSTIAFADLPTRQAIRDFLASKNVGVTIDNSVTVMCRDGTISEHPG